MTLRERALSANRQRDEAAEQESRLRLKKAVQSVLEIEVEPNDIFVEIEGYKFYLASPQSGAKLEMAWWNPIWKNGGRAKINCLADVGDTITMIESTEEDL